VKIETVQQALEGGRASSFGACLSTDEFVRFWQDRHLRSAIYRKAWLCSSSPEDEEDLRQEAWEAICMLGPEATFDMAEDEATKAIDRVRKKIKRREKYMAKVSLETSQ
jgi:hypothetical protein